MPRRGVSIALENRHQVGVRLLLQVLQGDVQLEERRRVLRGSHSLGSDGYVSGQREGVAYALQSRTVLLEDLAFRVTRKERTNEARQYASSSPTPTLALIKISITEIASAPLVRQRHIVKTIEKKGISRQASAYCSDISINTRRAESSNIPHASGSATDTNTQET